MPSHFFWMGALGVFAALFVVGSLYYLAKPMGYGMPIPYPRGVLCLMALGGVLCMLSVTIWSIGQAMVYKEKNTTTIIMAPSEKKPEAFIPFEGYPPKKT